jgi:hypothetical protein
VTDYLAEESIFVNRFWVDRFVYRQSEKFAVQRAKYFEKERREVSGFATGMFEIEYGQCRVKTRSKSRTEPLRPEKYVDSFMEHSWARCCYNASSESFIQCTMVHCWKLGPLA